MRSGKVLRVTVTRGETQKWHRCTTSKAKQSWAEVAKPPGLPKTSLHPRAKANRLLVPQQQNCLCERRCRAKPRATPGVLLNPLLQASCRQPQRGAQLLLQGWGAGDKPAPANSPRGAAGRFEGQAGPLVAQWLLSRGPLPARKQHHRHRCHIAPRNLEAVTLWKICKRPVPVFANEPNHVLTKGCQVCCTQWVMSRHSVQGLAVCHTSRLPQPAGR